MEKRRVLDWINQSTISQILLAFSVPITPRQVEYLLGINKLKLKPFVERGLIKCLNPTATKTRFYLLTDKARRFLKLGTTKKDLDKDWDTIGWIMGSPKQRLIVLKEVVTAKRTSEEIRERARSNQHLTRISTKGILKDLIAKGLIESELAGRRRYYWITEKGKLIIDELNRLFAS